MTNYVYLHVLRDCRSFDCNILKFFGRVGFWANAKIKHIVWSIFSTNCLDEIVV